MVFLEEGEQPIKAEQPTQVQEETMPEETQTPAVGQEDAVSLEQFNEVQLKLQQMEERLEAERSRSASLEQMAVKQFVDSIVIRAENYRDDGQRAHSKVALEWLENVLLEKPVGETIKLEEDAEIGDVRAYYRQAIANLFETMPGVVPMAQPQTEPAEDRMKLSHDGEDDELTLEGRNEIRGIWGKAPVKKEE